MHDIQAQLRMPNQHILELKRTTQRHSIFREPGIGSARGSEPDVDAKRDVSFFGYRKIWLELTVAGSHPVVLWCKLRDGLIRFAGDQRSEGGNVSAKGGI